MKIIKKDTFVDNSFIKLKDENWLQKQRIAGKVAARTLILLQNLVKEKTTKSLLELNSIAEEFIISNGCNCTFKGYKGFPAGVCISVNNQLVHGIPTDYKLQEGDVVSFDLGATFEEVIADTAITVIYGTPKSEKHVQLLQATENALTEGIKAISVGKRLGVIGNAIYKSAKSAGFNVIENYGGHGITIENGVGIPHAPPFVANKDDPNSGITIQPGLVIAIEPLLVIGSSTKTSVDKDGWTVNCEDICAHFEHSIYVHDNYIEIITDRNGL